MIITRTPYRISFFGGGSDYPCYYKEHGGLVLGTTIDKYCWIVVRKAAFGSRYRVIYSMMEQTFCIAEIEHPAIRRTLEYMSCPEGPLEIVHMSDLPARSGVGSSSAFVVGLIHALGNEKLGVWNTEKDPDFLGGYWTKDKLAQAAICVEQDFLKETVGSQDQILTSFGGLRKIIFSRDGKWMTDLVDIPLFVRRKLESNLLLFYTGVQRTASDVASSYVPEISGRSSIVSRLVEMVDIGIRFLEDGKLDDFGELLDEAWFVKRLLNERSVTSSEIDSIYNRAREAGALGGKLLGAGGGGFFLLYVPRDKQEKVRAALQGLTEVPFLFEDQGTLVAYND